MFLHQFERFYKTGASVYFLSRTLREILHFFHLSALMLFVILLSEEVGLLMYQDGYIQEPIWQDNSFLESISLDSEEVIPVLLEG